MIVNGVWQGPTAPMPSVPQVGKESDRCSLGKPGWKRCEPGTTDKSGYCMVVEP